MFVVSLLAESVACAAEQNERGLLDATCVVSVHPGSEDSGAVYTCKADSPALQYTHETSVQISVLREYQTTSCSQHSMPML